MNVALAWTGYVTGCVLVVAGVSLLGGIPWSLIATGVIVAGSSLLIDHGGTETASPDEGRVP